MFWSITRYDADKFLPLNPEEIGGHDVQAYNAFNTKPDKNGNVSITFARMIQNTGLTGCPYWTLGTISLPGIMAHRHGSMAIRHMILFTKGLSLRINLRR